MTGYTPLFRSVFTGSLCGQYPDTAAWLFLLALADKDGRVDMTPEYISRVTGMPLADLEACIGRFLDPDPASRSQENEGRRLVPIDPARGWGWKMVNFTVYRERARLMGKAAAEVESGRNAQRLRSRRKRPPVTAVNRPGPPLIHIHIHRHIHRPIPPLGGDGGSRQRGWIRLPGGSGPPTSGASQQRRR